VTDLSDIRRRMHDLTMAYERRKIEDPEKWTALFAELAIEARMAGVTEQEVLDFEAYERKHIIVAATAGGFRAWEQPFKG
jgi:hypothetical protein